MISDQVDVIELMTQYTDIDHSKEIIKKIAMNFRGENFGQILFLSHTRIKYNPGAGGDLVAMKGPQGFSFFS